MRTQVLTATTLLLAACRPPPAGPVPEPTPPPVVATPEPSGPVWPDEPFRAGAPTPGPIPELRLPSVETFKLANGLDVFLVEQTSLPTVTMYFEFDGGSVADPPSKIGLTSICLDLLDEGTKNLDKAAFEEKQADYAVNVSSSAGSESSNVSVRALKAQLGPALDLMAEMLQTPGLRKDDFDRIKDRRKAALLQAKASPGPVAGRLWNALVWGADHPYGRIETDKTIDAIKLSDCTAVINKLRPGGAQLWVTGMINRAELTAAIESRLPKWTGKAPARAKLAPAKPRLGTIFFVHIADAAQSSIYVGHPGPDRKAPDYAATDLMMNILGGSFASRINMNLREDKGYTYGGRAGIAYRRNGGTFTASSSVRTDVTVPALREVHKEIAGMRSGDPTTEELRRVQEGALLALPAQFATPSNTLSAFQRLDFYDLPLDWYAGYQQNVRAVDIPAVRKAAETHLRGQDFVVLVVGNSDVILNDLKQLANDKVFGDGGLVILDADGKPAAG